MKRANRQGQEVSCYQDPDARTWLWAASPESLGFVCAEALEPGVRSSEPRVNPGAPRVSAWSPRTTRRAPSRVLTVVCINAGHHLPTDSDLVMPVSRRALLRTSWPSVFFTPSNPAAPILALSLVLGF